MMKIWRKSVPLLGGLKSEFECNDWDIRMLSGLLKLNYHDTRESVSNEKAVRA